MIIRLYSFYIFIVEIKHLNVAVIKMSCHTLNGEDDISKLSAVKTIHRLIIQNISFVYIMVCTVYIYDI